MTDDGNEFRMLRWAWGVVLFLVVASLVLAAVVVRVAIVGQP